MNQPFSTKLLTNPDRLEIRDSQKNWVATFTLGCYTVILRGPQRTFQEENITITHNTWVRTLPQPFTGTLNHPWLTQALATNNQQNPIPDILAIALQYIQNAKPKLENNLQIAGDASYGPLPEGSTDNHDRKEGSDFHDYLGIPWKYSSNQPEKPDPKKFRCLDCSGFMRMVWGYRNNFPNPQYKAAIPLTNSNPLDPTKLPRRAVEMHTSAPGIIIIPNTGQQITDLTHLQIGDLVFFDTSNNDGTAIDHVGMYLGLDTPNPQSPKANHRFISSRKTANGPNFSDIGGKSILNGNGTYPKAFRAARRL